jgi:hypothetical protein
MGQTIDHPLFVKRPEQLTVTDFINITKMLESIINQSKSA